MVNNTENRITDEEIERIVNVVLNKVNDKKKCSPCNGETVTRSFKIYKNVLDDFLNIYFEKVMSKYN